MASRERRTPALEIDDLDQPADAMPVTMAERAEAEAEAEAAEALARAATARVRAIRLRREAEATQDDPSGDNDTAESDSNRDSYRRPGIRKGKAAGIAAAIGLSCAALSASGLMMWQHHIASQHRQHIAEFAAAARQDVMALMSLDPKKANDDMKRIADNSTGTFKGSFPMIADQLTKGLQNSNVATKVTVNDVAVESITDDSAIVLVAATTEASVPDGPSQPRSWHISLGLRVDGGRPKMSHVEFVQ
jgi:Mce-associated membrane protein